MQVHGSCVARKGEAVLLRGPPGSGKSGLALRLHSLGFVLVADDRVEIEIPPNGRPVASAPAALAGLIEVRGVGVVALPHAPARLALVIELGEEPRLPEPRRDAATGLPLIALDAGDPAAADKAALALDCALGLLACVAGAFERPEVAP
jgi:HPr kinase/phosphorylase